MTCTVEVAIDGRLACATGAAINAPDGTPARRIPFPQVPGPTSGKSRVHLDLRSPDSDAERADVIRRQAARLPEGDEFCV